MSRALGHGDRGAPVSRISWVRDTGPSGRGRRVDHWSAQDSAGRRRATRGMTAAPRWAKVRRRRVVVRPRRACCVAWAAWNDAEDTVSAAAFMGIYLSSMPAGRRRSCPESTGLRIPRTFLRNFLNPFTRRRTRRSHQPGELVGAVGIRGTGSAPGRQSLWFRRPASGDDGPGPRSRRAPRPHRAGPHRRSATLRSSR